MYEKDAAQLSHISESLERLKSTVEEELRYMHKLMKMLGRMDTLFSVAEVSTHHSPVKVPSTNTNSNDTMSQTAMSHSSLQGASQLRPSQTAISDVS